MIVLVWLQLARERFLFLMGAKSVFAYNRALFMLTLRAWENLSLRSLASVCEDSPCTFATRLTVLVVMLWTLRWRRGPAYFAHESLCNCSVVEVFQPVVVAGLLDLAGAT